MSTSSFTLGINKQTQLLMFDGSIRKASDITVNEKLMGYNDQPCYIVSTTNETGPMYRITPIGRCCSHPIECDSSFRLALNIGTRPYVGYIQRTLTFLPQWLQYDEHTDMVKAFSKSFSIGKYSSKEEAENEAKQFTSNCINLADSGFIWTPSIQQFQNANYYVRLAAKMTACGKIRFLEKEGQFANLLSRVFGHQPSNEQIKTAAWLVGAWLGDGTTGAPAFTVGKDEPEMLEYLEKAASVIGCGYHHRLNVNDPHPAYTVHYSDVKKKGNNNFMNLLRNLEIYNDKKVPEIMILDDIETVRYPLLAGLLDTDGSLVYDKRTEDGTSLCINVYDFVQKRKQITEAVQRITNISGMRCNNVAEKKIKYKGEIRSFWRCCISGRELDKLPIVIPRKKVPALLDRKSQPNKAPFVWGFKIEHIGDQEYVKIQYSGVKKIVLGDLTLIAGSSEDEIGAKTKTTKNIIQRKRSHEVETEIAPAKKVKPCI